jgi:(p)ppGpp synthase/HD superfamily hydrolase
MAEAVLRCPETRDALQFLHDAYRTRLRRDGRTIDHPIAVAELLLADGQRPELVTAGLLHDVLEDTEVPAGELAQRFGPEVAGLVQALTQDSSIPGHRERKAALREQVLDAGRDAATVALADKAAKLQSERRRPKERRLEHYRETLRGIEDRYGPSPLSLRLRQQLQRFDAAGGRQTPPGTARKPRNSEFDSRARG